MEEVSDDLEFFLGKGRSMLFPAWETLPMELVSPGTDISAARIKALSTVASNAPFLIITCAEALLQKIVTCELISSRSFTIRRGDVVNREQLVSALLDAGFTPARNVAQVGEYSAKGAVVDLFPSTSKQPVRVELRDGAVFGMRLFSADSQRSLSDIDEVRVIPVRELAFHLWHAADAEGVSARLKERAAATGAPPREVETVLQALEQRDEYPGLELLQYAAAPKELPTLLEMLPQNTAVLSIDPHQARHAIDELAESSADRAARLEHEQHLIPRASDVFADAAHIASLLANRTTLELSGIDDSVGLQRTHNVRAESTADLATRMRSTVGSGQAFQPLKAYLDSVRDSRYSVAFSVGSSSRAQRLQAILPDIGTDAPIVQGCGQEWIKTPRKPPVSIIVGHLSAGFKLPEQRLCFISENDIFSERSYRSSGAPRISAKRLLSALSLLKEGDFIVHIDYGIGVYNGLRHLTVEGILGDFLQIDYSDSRLYLPAHQIGKVQKFVATEGQQPHIDKLGSTRWFRTKQKIRDSIVTLAGDLIRLYEIGRAHV